MFIILFYSGLLGHLIQGPVAESRNIFEKDNCRDNWWTNILYINNFYNFKDMVNCIIGFHDGYTK